MIPFPGCWTGEEKMPFSGRGKHQIFRNLAEIYHKMCPLGNQNPYNAFRENAAKASGLILWLLDLGPRIL